MGGILSRAEGSPKASQNACRQAPNGRHFTVRDLLDAMVKHEKRLMRFPTGHAHFVGLRQHERWPAMYYVVWEWHPDEGEPFLIE